MQINSKRMVANQSINKPLTFSLTRQEKQQLFKTRGEHLRIGTTFFDYALINFVLKM